MHPPSVESLANSLLDTGLAKPLCVDIARDAVAEGDPDLAWDRAKSMANKLLSKMLSPVINATGVLLHTNMGRAPIPPNAPISSKAEPLTHSNMAAYTNLELDMDTGGRGSRQNHVNFLFTRLTGAEAALVVNNCAAAVTLILAALINSGGNDSGGNDGVAVSRGELVEIGGGFRVPEVIAQSGARLVEVGTTNRTRLKDYKKAIAKDSVGLCLKVHQSNYAIEGFSESVGIAELKDMAVPLVADLGSGLLDAACPWLESGPPVWLKNEPAAKQCLEAGADLVAFSGDKLMGGPQAGIIVGKADLIQKCSEHPLARAFRPGGLTIAALVDVAQKYLARAGKEIPFWQMASLGQEELSIRAKKILSSANISGTIVNVGIGVGECSSVTGGGTLPNVKIPSYGIILDGDYTAPLREYEIPIIGWVNKGKTILDLRTVFPHQDETLSAAMGSF